MSAWPTVALGDIFEIARGGSPRPIDAFTTDDPKGINWVMIGDATEGSKYITATKKRIRPEGASRSRRVKPGDFLLTNSMSFGKPYIMRTDGCVHDGWLVLSPKNGNVDPDFFYYLLGSNATYAEFARRASGATVKNLNIDLVRGVTVARPPLPEQRRIAAILDQADALLLDQADALRAKRRAAIHKLDELTQSIFLDMFGDPTTNPRSWPMEKLGKIGTLDRGASKHKPRNAPELLGGPYPFVQTGDVANCGGYITQYSATYSDAGLKQSKMWPAGTLCITIAANIAKTGILTFDACFPDSVVGFSAEPATVEYVRCWLSFLQASLEAQAPEFAQKNINLKILRGLDVPAPDSALIAEFARRVMSTESLKRVNQKALRNQDAFFRSLQQRAFRGEL